MIQLHRLEGFYRVALAGGYTRAAREFPYPISQPGVHQQVSKLEAELGKKLFERKGRDSVTLTAAGRRLFDFVQPFFEGLPLVAREIGAGSFGGVLRIDAAALEIRYLMPRWIQQLRRARPDIDVDLEEVQVPDFSRLANGKTDLLVDYLPELPAGMEAKRVGTHYIFIVIPKQGFELDRSAPSLRSLRGKPFVSFHPSLPHCQLQLNALDALGADQRKMLSASSTEAILGFVAAGLGYSLVPWPDARGPQFRGVTAIRQKGRGTEFPISAAWRKRAEPDPLIGAALGALGSRSEK
ncbi:MAG TPA: LysR family transcriptional regulator [Polyangiaceae bacterium]|nr:LysR family transcriptional regulator [Polyangiaceae bacterium]